MAGKKQLDAFCRRAVELGALEAKVVETKKVYTGPWVRLKCRYGCACYGGCLTCPPHSPTPEETRAVLDSYKSAILIHGGEHTDLREMASALEREVFLAGFYKAFAYACGPCNLCSTCDFENGCRHPDQARPAMEAAGIDVFATARAAGFPIKVLKRPGEKGNYYALVLVE